MSRIPLQTLPAFRMVATLGSVRAAAQTLHLTHSAVSQQLRLLEDQLGFVLFDRTGKRVVLNPAGAAFLRAVDTALVLLEDGTRAAELAAHGTAHTLRLSVLPSFAQHWLLPRMALWRAAHPDITVELHTAQRLVDIRREGFHAALRQGSGPWPGLEGTRLVDTPLVVVSAPDTAARLAQADPRTWIDEALLGDAERWERWFAQCGHDVRVQPVAVFNDMGMLVQAAKQGLGIALCRQLVAADALRDGQLVQMSPIVLAEEGTDTFWLLHTPEMRDAAPLVALRSWLQSQMALN